MRARGISAQKRLLSHTRSFFDAQMRGLFVWDDVLHHPPIDNDPLPGDRPNPIKHKERVTMTFGDYELTVHSPGDEPPLGWITIANKSATWAHGGPLDESTWSRIGPLIRKRENGEK